MRRKQSRNKQKQPNDAIPTTSYCITFFLLFTDNTSVQSCLHFFSFSFTHPIILKFIFSTPIQIVFIKVISDFYITIYKDQFSLLIQPGGSFWGQFCLLSPGDSWQCLEAFLVVKSGGCVLLLASSGQRLGMQLNIPATLLNIPASHHKNI